jgi:hypothetical protein
MPRHMVFFIFKVQAKLLPLQLNFKILQFFKNA